MKHPWTTVAGVLTILGAVCSLIAKLVVTKQLPNTDELAALGAAFTAGVGLVKSADATPPSPPKA